MEKVEIENLILKQLYEWWERDRGGTANQIFEQIEDVDEKIFARIVDKLEENNLITGIGEMPCDITGSGIVEAEKRGLVDSEKASHYKNIRFEILKATAEAYEVKGRYGEAESEKIIQENKFDGDEFRRNIKVLSELDLIDPTNDWYLRSTATGREYFKNWQQQSSHNKESGQSKNAFPKKLPLQELQRLYLIKLYELAEGNVYVQTNRQILNKELNLDSNQEANLMVYFKNNNLLEFTGTDAMLNSNGLLKAEEYMAAMYAEKESLVLQKIYEMGNKSPEVWVLINELEKALGMSFQELNPVLNDLEERKKLIGSVNEAVWIVPAGIEALQNQNIIKQIPINYYFNMQNQIDSKKVFVVHGQDNEAKESVARFLKNLDLEPIILHEQANAGRTIIEKFEHHSSTVGYAVVLLTPDDLGCSKSTNFDSTIGQIMKAAGQNPVKEMLNPRARQNVIFELGYFFAKLKRDKVCALYKEGVELPSDFQGILYISMDAQGAWKSQLAREMREAGLDVDMNKI